jgi:hypothetical protein
VTLNLIGISELSQDVLGQYLLRRKGGDDCCERSTPWRELCKSCSNLPKLDTHLVVRVDTPDGTLDMDLVLCQGDTTTSVASSTARLIVGVSATYRKGQSSFPRSWE